MKPMFPPAELSSFDRKSTSRLLTLAKTLRSEPLVLFLGAGVPASAGLPTWNELMVKICQIFFFHWQSDVLRGAATAVRPPKNLSIMFTSDSEDLEMMLPDGNETMALGNEFASGNPVLAAQQIKNCIREADWIYLLRKCLYGERNSKEIQISPLVDRLAAICGEPGCVQAVVNYNYDSIFEDYLSLKSIKYVVRSEADQRGKPRALPIYHVHGYLKRGGGPKTKIVLAEDDYHANLAAPHSWSNLLQSSFLARSTCVFIGTSMTDPNLRRILRSAVGVGNRGHCAFLPSDVTSERAIMANSLFDQDLRTLGVLAIRYPSGNQKDPPHAWLPRCINWLLEQRKCAPVNR